MRSSDDHNNVEKPEHHEAFVQSMNNCPLCGTLLDVKHEPDPHGLSLKEEANCSHCELRTRAKTYRIH